MPGGSVDTHARREPVATQQTANSLLAASRFPECVALAGIGIAAHRAAPSGHTINSQSADVRRERLADACYVRGFALMRMGNMREALKDLALPSDHPGPRQSAALAASVECHIARGDLDRAEQLEPRLSALGQDPAAVWGRAELAEARGDHELAATHFREVGDLLGGRRDPTGLLEWHAARAMALTRLGRRSEAVDLAHEALRRSAEDGTPYSRAQAQRTLAAVDATSDCIDLLRTALTTVRAIAAKRFEAQICTDLAGILVLTGDRDEVPELLDLAEEIAIRHHLRPLHDRILRVRQVMEPEPPRFLPPDPSLTRGEQRVAQLAADGMSNREIAEHLVVTIKAVEWHLSNVYRKLEIPGRQGLLDRMRPVPAVPLAR